MAPVSARSRAIQMAWKFQCYYVITQDLICIWIKWSSLLTTVTCYLDNHNMKSQLHVCCQITLEQTIVIYSPLEPYHVWTIPPEWLLVGIPPIRVARWIQVDCWLSKWHLLTKYSRANHPVSFFHIKVPKWLHVTLYPTNPESMLVFM